MEGRGVSSRVRAGREGGEGKGIKGQTGEQRVIGEEGVDSNEDTVVHRPQPSVICSRGGREDREARKGHHGQLELGLTASSPPFFLLPNSSSPIVQRLPHDPSPATMSCQRGSGHSPMGHLPGFLPTKHQLARPSRSRELAIQRLGVRERHERTVRVRLLGSDQRTEKGLGLVDDDGRGRGRGHDG